MIVSKKMSSRVALAVGILAALLLCSSLRAQETTGNITGTVSDPSGATIPNASVTVTNTLTGVKRTAATTSAGVFYFSRLPVGEYKIAVENTGFKTYETTGVRLDVNDKLNFPITLQIGNVSERVTVTSEAPTLQTESGEVSNLIGSAQIQDMPLNGRVFAQLVDLVPGVTPESGRVGGGTGIESDSAISVNGNQSNSNMWLIDGQNNIGVGSNNGNTVTPSVDSIEEFKVLRNNFSAEFGLGTGGVINIITKSGSQAFHGSAFEFGRNDALDAGDFFLNANGQQKSKLRQHDYGVTVGGPFFIPGKYNENRNKDFFFFSFEGRREIRGQVSTSTVPTERQKQGILDPGCMVTEGPCTIQPADPLEIPLFDEPNLNSSLIDPNARAMLERYPLPNANYEQNGFNWILSDPQTKRDHQELVRWDHNISEKASLMVRYIREAQTFEKFIGWGHDAFPSVNSDLNYHGRNIVISLTNTLTPRLVNEFQVGYNSRPFSIADGKTTDPHLTSREGFTYTELFPETSGSFPRNRSVEDFDTVRHQANYFNEAKIFQVKDNVSYTFGKHNLRTGFFLGKNRLSQMANGGGDQTAGVIKFPSFYDMLLGNIRDYTEEQTTNPVPSRMTDLAFFVQDNWKVRPNLTLDWGLRWQYMSPLHSAKDNISNFYPDRYDPSRCSVNAFNEDGLVDPALCDTMNGIVTPQSPGVPTRALVERHFNDWEPRLGLAWSPLASKKFVFRAGAGTYHGRDAGSLTSAIGRLPPFNSTANLNGISFSQLAPFNPDTPQAPLFLLTLDPIYFNPQSYQYSTGFQYEIRPNTTLDVNYVGSHQIHQGRNRDINQVPEQYRRGVAEGSIDPNTVRPYLGFTNIYVNERAGDSHYNSLQTFFNHRMQKGIQFQAAYTWSTLISNVTNQDSEANNHPVQDASRAYLEKAFAPQDQRHSFTFNYIWQLPFFNNSKGVTKTLLGGWEFVGITTFRSGFPVTFTCIDGDVAGLGGSECQRPNVIAPVNIPSSERTLRRWFNTDAFVLQEPGTFGNAGKSLIREPGINNWDFSIFKNFQFKETVKLQFRADFFNGWNHTQFSGLATDFVPLEYAAGSPADPNSAFGSVTGTRPPREIQLGLKLVW